MPRTPIATYRVQFGPRFGFRQARALLPYLRALGVSDLYASPLLEARRGSPHGYDVTDPGRLRAELGSRRDFDGLTRALRREGMGFLLDIVPNHLALSAENPMLVDVLARGRSSRFARVFDIDWRAGEGVLVLPVLGAPLADVLARGELRVERRGRRAWLRYHEQRFPLAPETSVPRRRTPEAMARLLDAQHYRLVDWREPGNYRRFFDITDLIAVRVEDPTVFALTHRLIGSLARSGAVTSLRVDHIDGLRDPEAYLRRLARTTGTPVVVEKILGPGEEPVREWTCAGDTGYAFLVALTGVFVDPTGLRRLSRIAGRFTGERRDPAREAVACKARAMRELFGAETDALARSLHAIARRSGRRDLSSAAIRDALVEITAHLEVYRTYQRRGRTDRADARRIRAAARAARADGDRALRSALGFVERVLLQREEGAAAAAFRVVERWQQLSGPVMAKGVEDTASYRSVALLARSEVGAHPGSAPGGVAAFHALNRARLARWPGSLSATSTHDTKRSEDVRARLAVLAEVPDRWERALRRWRRLNARHRTGDDPDAHEELVLYQTLVGAWPAAGSPGRGFAQRIQDAMHKAAREAKRRTSWRNPDADYERALRTFVGRVLAHRRFLDELRRFVDEIAPAGALYALGQVVLKVAAPGIPDFYQGTEGWHHRLVDPDNRAPVDFAERERLLADLDARADSPALIEELLETWRDGRIKLYVTKQSLRVRAADPDLFLHGAYLPVTVRGDPVCAFARRRQGRWALAVVPRLAGARGGPPLGRAAWGGATLALPARAPGTWTDAFTGREVRARGGRLALADVFGAFPVALLSARRTSSPGSR